MFGGWMARSAELPWVDIGSSLFVLLLMLLSVALVLLLLSSKLPNLYRPLTVITIVSEICWLMILALEMANVKSRTVFSDMETLSVLFANHRWLLVPLPTFFLLLAPIILLVYRTNLRDRHAKDYRRTVGLSLWGSLASLLLISFEALL